MDLVHPGNPPALMKILLNTGLFLISACALLPAGDWP